jgi:anthranilate synthase/aminodeoxychorismate synthase-like glutamine amidotransferase
VYRKDEKMLVVIDNYDSFTYNLVQYFGDIGGEVKVFRNDMISVAELADMQPQQIVISPGPGAPIEAGISKDVITQLGDRIPILGVCLGHQCIGEVFGGRVVRAGRLMHGKTSWVYHNGDALFHNVPNPFEATRYHSLIVEDLPACLTVTGFTEEGEVMALRHREAPIFGVQFHPESILTQHGKTILKNFIEISATSVGMNPTKMSGNSTC